MNAASFKAYAGAFTKGYMSVTVPAMLIVLAVYGVACAADALSSK